MSIITKKIDVTGIEESIELLNIYAKDASIEPVMLVLERIKNNPDDASLAVQLTDALDSIGVMKGAVLNYAPYIALLVSNGLFDDD